MSDDAAQRIGDYEIIRELGHGGMGKVYLGRNVLSDPVEALKVFLPDLAGRSEFVSRFMREIKMLASLDQPNIAHLCSAFTAGDQFVMVMEYVDGVTLSELLGQHAHRHEQGQAGHGHWGYGSRTEVPRYGPP